MTKRSNQRTWVVMSIVLMACVSPSSAKVIYVDANAPGPAQDGSSWTNAYNYLQDALADAGSAAKPVEMRVAQGIYKPDANTTNPIGSGDQVATFQLLNGVALKGGYAGFGQPDPNARNIELFETILSGDINTSDVDTDNSYHVVTGSEVDANAIISGFTITAGNSDGSEGGGMFNNSGSPTVTNCIFINNLAILGGGMCNLNNSNPMLSNCSFSGNVTPPWGEGCGGNGVFNYQSSPTLVNCIFYENSGGSYGGGMCNEASSPTLTDCYFRENTGYRYGGGIANFSNSNPKLTNCIFSGCSSRNGGGICNYYDSNPTLTNCIFVDNSAEWGGGGMKNYQSNPTLTNCTFVENTGNAYDGGGIHNRSNSSTLRNCIFWGNIDSGGTDESAQIHNDSGGSADVSYCCIQGLDIFTGSGNIGNDPCFADADANDFHLKSLAGRWDPNSQSWVKDDVTSPCIDAGNPGCPLGNEPNDPNNVRINLGAYGGTAEASKSPANWLSIADITNDWIVDSNDLKVFVNYWLETGECIPGDLNRTQSTNFVDFALLANNWLRTSHGESVFDFAVATKGPLHIAGNIELEGTNISVESDVYIVSENSNLALEIIGNSLIAGDVFITNPDATVDLQGGLFSIGGETGEAALNHVHTGVHPIAFPVPNPSYFEHYVVSDINYPSTETTFENIRIPPNTNPIFSDVILQGIIYIETPNMVTFTGHVNITGIIVGDGNINDDSGTNRIDFLYTVDSSPVTDLPAEFGELREETGTFLMAPGFSLSFGGGFETINGAIAANGIEFYGNAGGTIEGSLLNYSDTAMELSGNNDLYFNRFADTEIPAGFE